MIPAVQSDARAAALPPAGEASLASEKPAVRRHHWLDVCALADLLPSSGAAALLDGRQIALVRVGESDLVYALSNFDPFSEAFVIARGIVGDRAGRPKIASPIFKQSFDLETGVCLDDPGVVLPTYPARVREGRVQIVLKRWPPSP